MMNFGEAINALKQGKKVARTGWNGKGMYLYLTSGSVINFDELKTETQNSLRATFGAGTDQVEICSHIDMKAADNSVVIGWLASQTDMLAEDWVIIE